MRSRSKKKHAEMTDTIILFLFDAIIVISKEYLHSSDSDSNNVRESNPESSVYAKISSCMQ